MKLDNRPKKLLIKGVSDDGVQAVRNWYGVRYAPASVAARDDTEIIFS